MDNKPQKLAIIRLAGFTPVVWSVISLPRKGEHECKRKSEDLSKFLTENTNSAVVICGTTKAPKHQQGKILGLAYCSKQVVRSEPLIAKHMREKHFRNQLFQYPWGLPIERAVYFAAPYAETDEILGRELTKRIPRNKYLECNNQTIISKILGLEVELEINFSESGLVSSPEPLEPDESSASPTFLTSFALEIEIVGKLDTARTSKEDRRNSPSTSLMKFSANNGARNQFGRNNGPQKDQQRS